MFGTGLDIAIGILLTVVFAHYAGFTKKITKAFRWIVAGAISYVLAGVFETTPYVTDVVSQGATNYGFGLFAVIGFIFVLVGTLWAMYQLLTE